MGEVYLAQDTKLDRKVALKILPADLSSLRDRMERFVREAKSAAALNHPNIAQVHEIGENDGIHFIAMEFINGVTLRHRLSSSRLNLNEVLDICIQVTNALATAHQAGIIHRDMKPENIMIRPDGIVKVLDFGLAKLTAHESRDVDTEASTKTILKTDPGTVVGTAVYMSPEQARGIPVDERTDIFSVGVVLYEMVAGCLPFAGSTSSEVLASILSDKEPQPLARYAREVPAELERVVSKALRKYRDERYQTIKDFLLDLKSLKKELEFEAKLERTTPPELTGAGGAAKPTAGQEVSTGPGQAAAQTAAEVTRATSSSDLIASRIKRHSVGALLALAALVAVAATVVYLAYSRAGGGGSGAIRSIAVLPFTNTDGNPDAEYLSDGIAESLVNSLSQMPGIKVIARSSSFRYRGNEVDLQEVAKSLGVEAILTGRVVQRGDNLLISAELVNVSDKTHIWGDQYNRKAVDVLQIQSEIAREIAEKLRLRLTTGERQQLAKRETANPQAYELFLKGRFYWNKGGTENAKKAVEYFQQAIAVDPTYAPAYAELSHSYGDLVNASILDPKEFTPKAEAAARKALELDESLAEAHLAHGGIKVHTWDWAGAEREFKRAIELNPNLATARSYYAFYLGLVGQHEQAIAAIKRARELDPLSAVVNALVGYQYFMARQHDQAIEALKKSLELEQNNPYAIRLLADVYAMKGMYAEAIASYQEVIKLGEAGPGIQIYLGAACAKAGERERALLILKRLETKKEFVSPGELAVLYLALGEREKAYASLEQAYAVHDSQLQFLGVDPSFDPLRSDPRFQDLMRRVGLPQ
jgi:serine/threonine-protein kinase